MIFGLLTLFTALSMATVAAVFAIYGIIAIFAGMPQFALVMGAVIELGKVVGISWLYRNWNEPTKIKYAMAPLVLVAMMLTSMGIFGLLSKAHLEQTSPVANNEVQITRLNQHIAREQSRIADSEEVISQLDKTVQTLIDFERIRGADGALAVREDQAEQRDLLRQTIDSAQAELDRLEDQKLKLTQELTAIELEVGPVKYIAELVYGNDTDRTEEAVRLVIIAFIFVFDPMAILLLMAANYTIENRHKKPTIVPIPTMEPIVPATSETIKKPETNNQETTEPLLETKEQTKEQTNDDDQSTTKIEVSDSAGISEPIITESTNEQPESLLILPEPIQEPEPHDVPLQHSGEDNTILAEPSLYSAVDDAALVMEESAAKKKEPDIITEGVTPAIDVGNGYVKYNDHLYQQEALKVLQPELFALRVDQPQSFNSSFGTQFPRIAKKKDIFVRVDAMPNRVYRFDGNKWIEINKDLTSTYLYDNEYMNYLLKKIDSGEYDIELLSEAEKIQIEDYLNNKAK